MGLQPSPTFFGPPIRIAVAFGGDEIAKLFLGDRVAIDVKTGDKYPMAVPLVIESKGAIAPHHKLSRRNLNHFGKVSVQCNPCSIPISQGLFGMAL